MCIIIQLDARHKLVIHNIHVLQCLRVSNIVPGVIMHDQYLYIPLNSLLHEV